MQNWYTVTHDHADGGSDNRPPVLKFKTRFLTTHPPEITLYHYQRLWEQGKFSGLSAGLVIARSKPLFFSLQLPVDHTRVCYFGLCSIARRTSTPLCYKLGMLTCHSLTRSHNKWIRELTFCCLVRPYSSAKLCPKPGTQALPLLSQCQPGMLTCHSVAQYLDKRTYLLLLGWAVTAKLCPKPGTQAFPLVVTLTVSALDADMLLTDSVTQ